MDSYKNFAYVYDSLMEDVSYESWVMNLEEIWFKNNFKPKMILDLGCGTGNITLKLAEKNYDMIGVDISVDMLNVAKEKCANSKNEILFICQDMKELDLFGTVDCVISLCDSLNYMTDEKDLLQVFKLVNNFLNPKGLFVFDMNSKYKLSKILGNNSFSNIKEELVCAWENYFDEENNISEYYTNVFVKNKNGLYERFEEFHYEKAYSVETVIKLLEEAGMEFVEVYDSLTFSEPNEESERIYFIAREKGK